MGIDMPEPTDRQYHAKRAEDSREMAERAATPAARTIHLALAGEHDAKALDAITGAEEGA
jgi:hypothetical protein